MFHYHSFTVIYDFTQVYHSHMVFYVLQVHNNAKWYHLTPFTLLPVMYRLQQQQVEITYQ